MLELDSYCYVSSLPLILEKMYYRRPEIANSVDLVLTMFGSFTHNK